MHILNYRFLEGRERERGELSATPPNTALPTDVSRAARVHRTSRYSNLNVIIIWIRCNLLFVVCSVPILVR